MNIAWLGHSCFCLEEDGYRILADPYDDAVDGYPPLRAEAHAVYCSHEHHDHNFREGVTLLPERKSPFTVRTVDTFHDDRQGAQRGPNKIHIFTARGVTAVHLGDLGHPLSAAQVREIGPCDLLMVPVGGYYTIDAPEAKAVTDALAPRTVVPMHYRHVPFGLPPLAGVEEFLRLCTAWDVERLKGNRFSVTKDTSPKLFVPCYPASAV